MITAGQMRAARALLGIDQRQLAELAGVSLPTIQRMEASMGNVRGVDRYPHQGGRSTEPCGYRADRRRHGQPRGWSRGAPEARFPSGRPVTLNDGAVGHTGVWRQQGDTAE